MVESKIQDAEEARRWIKEGKTYRWIVNEYRRKYHLETSISMWSNFRSKEGLPRRYAWDVELVPWSVREVHTSGYHAQMLRAEARRRAGLPLSKGSQMRLAAWRASLEEYGRVIHYEPDTHQGFFAVPPRPGVDTDLIRVPDSGVRRQASRED